MNFNRQREWLGHVATVGIDSVAPSAWPGPASIQPKAAQTSARHSEIRLTVDVYTHAELADQTVAIGALPGE